MTPRTTIVAWLWGHRYSLEHVRRLKRALDRNTTVPFDFHVIRDMSPLIQAVGGWKIPTRSRLRRIALLSAEMEKLFGPRILQLDIDIAITRNIDHILTDPADFKIWRSGSIGERGHAYNPTVMLMRTGILDHVWQSARHDPVGAMMQARGIGWTGSDQAIISAALEPDTPVWTQKDGIYAWRDDDISELPANACIVSFHGDDDPARLRRIDWVRRAWR